MKRLCLLALVFLLALSALSVYAEAFGEYTSGDFDYVLLEDGTACIAYWGGAARELAVPAELDGHAVSALGEYAFAYSEALERVIVPEGVTRIDDGAFEGCASLVGIELPDSVEALGANPFRSCVSLAELEVSESNPSLYFDGSALFARADGRLVSYLDAANAGTYAVPAGTRVIGAKAFDGCASLKRIELPEGLIDIGDGAFSGCESLERLTLPAGLEAIGDYAFENCVGLRAVELPDGLEAIGICAFEACENLREIVLPEGLKRLGDQAFATCASLERSVLPASLEQVGLNPFMDCEALIDLEVPAGTGFFVAEGVLFGDGGARLISYPRASKAQAYAVPEGTANIDDFAFYCCNALVSVAVPDSVTAIGASAFEGRENLTLTVGRDSYAQSYARENALKYTYPDADAWLNG